MTTGTAVKDLEDERGYLLRQVPADVKLAVPRLMSSRGINYNYCKW